MVRLSVIVPCRHDGAHRTQAWEWVRRRWLHIAPGAEIVTADSDGDTFSYAQAANRAVVQSTGDIVMFAGLEQTVDLDWVRVALPLAERGVWLRQDVCHMLSKAESKRLLTEPPDIQLAAVETDWSGQASLGMAMFPRHKFEQIGGYDERHEGWGWEDCCLRLAADTLLGPPVLFGAMWHFWHPTTDADTWIQPHCDEQKSLYQRYEEAEGDPDAMRALIAEHR